MILNIHPKYIALSAAALLALIGIAAVPVLAAGGSSQRGVAPATAANQVPAELLRARAKVERSNANALATVPRSRTGACTTTKYVAGLGRACRTRTGLLGIKLDDGSTMPTHGADAPPVATPSFLPGSGTAISHASASDISCVSASEKRTVMIYARPSNRTSRVTRVKPLMQQAAYKMSAFLGAESRSVDPNKSKKMRFECGSDGKPLVVTATVRAVGANGGDFNQIVSDLTNQGFDSYNKSGSTARYIVYYDAPSASGAAGLGSFWNSTEPGIGSRNNLGGVYAVEFAWSTWSEPLPTWDIMLHEASHNMGAVVNAAANASGGGHCNDGMDIMCYNDGGSKSHYVTTKCATEQFDCGRNDYFNPSPAPGSFLAKNWNIAAPYNQFLDHIQLGDTTAPTAPGVPRLTGASNAALALVWTPASDNKAVTRYEVDLQTGSSWINVVTTTQLAATVSDLDPNTQYTISVRAFDAAGNASSRSTTTLRTTGSADDVPPRAPNSVVLVKSTFSSIQLRWDAAIDDVGVLRYEVLRVDRATSGTNRQYRSLGNSDGTTFVAKGLAPNTLYVFQVVAIDAAGNQSDPVEINARTARDRIRPTAPRILRAQARGVRAVRVAWTPSRDNVRVVRYDLYRVIPRRGWVRTNILPPSRRVVTIPRLRRHEKVILRVRATDSSGNVSWFSPLLRTSAR